MIVKVCGVRTAEIANTAVEAGADWIGLVFVPASPRHVQDEEAGQVAAAVKGRADLIGVFVDPTLDELESAVERFGLAGVQVHGRVRRELAERCSVMVIPGINPHSPREAFTVDWWPDLPVLLDSAGEHGQLPGGTGRRAAVDCAREVARHRPIVLAGGLSGSNVQEAVRAVRPWGVDASSRLESSPGVKDGALVVDYVQRARVAVAGVA
ncbi:MAG TPA: phosphoribosylanthranilate isomerase [Candidatus Sulfotelmatobacter sp.]|nr:phosphoribosylanthranilate isomerase [Candidatus Sulfotelmatobacter sp.]